MKTRSERSRWTTVFTLGEPCPNVEGAVRAKERHGQLRAVVEAFASVGRVIRVEPSKFGLGLVFKARKA